MKLVKRILGVIGMILGTLGVVLCLAVIIGAWWVNGPITEGLLTVFPPIEAALAFGDETAEQFGVYAGQASDRLDEAADVETLANQIENELVQVSIYVDVASGIASSIEETVSEVSEPVRSNEDTPLAARTANRVVGELETVNRTLDSVSRLALDVSDGRLEKVDQLSAGLEDLEGKAGEVQATIGQTEEDVREIKSSIPRWIDLGSLIVTLIFLWFGIAQFLLLRQSWAWFRRPGGGIG